MIHGAKNSALPILAATILSGDVSEISNCPRLSDVAATQAILRHLGCRVEEGDGRVLVDSSGMCRSDIPDSLMREMRSSIVFLGAIAADRPGSAVLSGGCELGPRRLICIWRHCAVWDWKLRRNVDGSTACARGRSRGTAITLEQPSVGATENILMASATAQGTTVIVNAAREPEIVDLCAYLNACGARITGAGEGTVVIEGVDRLTGCPPRGDSRPH